MIFGMFSLSCLAKNLQKGHDWKSQLTSQTHVTRFSPLSLCLGFASASFAFASIIDL